MTITKPYPNALANASREAEDLPWDEISDVQAALGAEKWAFWHGFYAPVLFADETVGSDYYERKWLTYDDETSAAAEPGSHRSYGGLIRERTDVPLPRTSGAGFLLADLRHHLQLMRRIGVRFVLFDLFKIDKGGGTSEQTRQWTLFLTMLDAAALEGMKVGVCFDCAAGTYFGTSIADVSWVLGQVWNHSALAKRSGKAVVGAFRPDIRGTAEWTAELDACATAGTPGTLWPILLNARQAGAGSAATWAAVSHVFRISDWSSSVHSSTTLTSGTGSVGATITATGKEWGAMIVGEDVRPDELVFDECKATLALRKSADAALAGAAAAVLLRTWNDVSEHQLLSPTTGGQCGFWLAAGYELFRLSTGSYPTIVLDRAVILHRTHPGVVTPTRYAKRMQPRNSVSGDIIEGTFYLADAATVRLVRGTAVDAQSDASSGRTILSAPLQAGYPGCEIVRDNETVRIISPFLVSMSTAPEYQDGVYRGTDTSDELTETTTEDEEESMPFPSLNAAVELAITVPVGTRWVLPMTINGSDGEPVDLTGTEMTATISSRLDSARVVLAEPSVTITDAEAGTFQIELTKTQTESLLVVGADDPLRRRVRVGAWELVAEYLGEKYRVAHGDVFADRTASNG